MMLIQNDAEIVTVYILTLIQFEIELSYVLHLHTFTYIDLLTTTEGKEKIWEYINLD